MRQGWLPVLFVLSGFWFLNAHAEWVRDLPRLEQWGTGHGRWVRTLFHLHSVYSHDACDDKPQNSDGINLKCRKDFREGLCRNHIDVAFMGEHSHYMGLTDFNELLVVEENDLIDWEGEWIVSTRIPCEDGHEVLLLPGGENAVMPIGFLHHPEAVGGKTLKETYGMSNQAAITNFRQSGAMVGVNHLEDHEPDELLQIAPDFVESYNLHANFSQSIEDLDFWGWIKMIIDYSAFFLNSKIESDLFYLIPLAQNEKTEDNWAYLSEEFGVMPGVFGTDAHQNVLNFPLFDGERVDSYRRMMRWLSNHLFIEGDLTRESVMSAISQARLYGTFEVFGTPYGFDFSAEQAGYLYTTGQSVGLSQGSINLVVKSPEVLNLGYELGTLSGHSEVKLKILKASKGHWKIVAESTESELVYRPDTRGIYRSEVWVNPDGLKPYLKSVERFMRYSPWIVSNPIQINQ